MAQRFSFLRTLKIGSFHIGSAFTDLLTSGVLNRVLIGDLGIAATPVAFLSALRYLLAPLSIWTGYRSDTKPIFGLHRLPYIWLGRLPMVISLPLLPLVAVLLAADPRSILGWTLATISFLVYGVGTLLSGSPFLALVRDTNPPAKRGIAMSIVQMFLIVSFPVAAIVYGRMLPHYDPAAFWKIVLAGMGIAAFFFLFSIFGEERRGQGIVVDEPHEHLPFMDLLREMWADPRTRYFFLFLALGAASASAQDAILEPFGFHVFNMSAGETTRFNAYWGGGVLISLPLTIFFTRRRMAYEQSMTNHIGLVVTSLALVLLGYVAVTANRGMLVPVLFLFGLGYGIYTVGALSLLMAMTSDRRAGAYLGLWTVAQLVFRGLGIFLGGAGYDLFYRLTGAHTLAYGTVFFVEAVGLLACIWLVIKTDVPGFAKSEEARKTRAASLAAVDL
ncbi:PUCC protein [Oscillochloris trichoides DG-6]|uniref:PUCC protein n=1 Tax=Oscillochloris trichoides DG-6 TaxID=765420 RepID=E1IC45_9CHLR|nr:BCD family MFS transporter [Oscillochloris trichoides]EFO81235.1 PUCC protein [Oscillochloris trichoides DG-6]